MPTPQNYKQQVLTENGNIITDGGRLMYVVLTGDGGENACAVAFSDDSAGAGNLLFTLRVGATDSRVVDFHDVGGYAVPSDKDLYATLSNVDCVIVFYED